MDFLKKIDRYILGKFLQSFFFAMLIMAVISCVIDYSEKIEEFLQNEAPAGQILLYFITFVPSILAILFPLFVFISTIFFTSKLAYKSEIIAILATGTSFTRFLRSYVVGGFLLGLLSLIMNHFIVPKTSVHMNRFLNDYFWPKKTSSDGNTHLKISDSTYIFMQNFTFSTKEGTQFTWEYFDGVLLREKIIADRASYDIKTKVWKLLNVVHIKNDGLKETLKKDVTIDRKFPFTPDDLDVDKNIKTQMTTPELLAFINRERQRGTENVTDFEIEYHKRTAQPVAGFILVIIAACIASRKVRGGSGLHLAIGISMSSTYILMMQLTTTFSTNSGLHPLLAVWIPNIIFGIVAFVLYRRQIR